MIIDTNILVRYFIGEGEQAKEAETIIDSAKRLVIDDIVLFECTYILYGHYQKSRRQIARALLLFLQKKYVAYESGLAEHYFGLYQSSSLDLADCYLIALSIEHNETLRTFDKKMLKVYDKEKAKQKV